jgi:hypothetical protein
MQLENLLIDFLCEGKNGKISPEHVDEKRFRRLTPGLSTQEYAGFTPLRNPILRLDKY